MLLARRKESFEDIVSEIRQAGGQALGITADVSNAAALKSALETIKKELPGSKLAAAVCNVNAGFVRKPFLELKQEDLDAGLNGSV